MVVSTTVDIIAESVRDMRKTCFVDTKERKA